MSVQMRPNEDHEVLGSEFCSGYTDSLGKWNPGFYCPTLDTTEAVYCCGSSNYKYCCTKKDEAQHEIPNLLLVMGLVAGVVLAIVMVTIVSCFFCSCCVLYKKRQTPVNGGPLYHMHCSSTGSGVANMYSFSNQNSSVTTPVDTIGHNHALADVHYSMHATTQPHHHHKHTSSPPKRSFVTPPVTPIVALGRCVVISENKDRDDCISRESSSSVSISFREPTPIQGNPTRSPNNHHRANSPALSGTCSSSAQCSTPANDESLFRSTKF